MDRLKLEPTAALVMAWALPLYKEGTIGDFVRQLDLSSGQDSYAAVRPQ